MSHLFLQSEVDDPFSIYQNRLLDDEILWDNYNQVWCAYRYDDVSYLLNHPEAGIPPFNSEENIQLNEIAAKIANRLARLNNLPIHEMARKTLNLLNGMLNESNANSFLDNLLSNAKAEGRIDWVGEVCKRLPITLITSSLYFEESDAKFISDNIQSLTSLTAGKKTNTQIDQINDLAELFYSITSKQIASNPVLYNFVNEISVFFDLKHEDALAYCTSNLIGLFIQCYDAGRGILSNVILHMDKLRMKRRSAFVENQSVGEYVAEVMRFDPPVHHTRRTATDTIVVSNQKIQKGQSIILFLAASNRDGGKFIRPNEFDQTRSNNKSMLSFGSGMHACIAAQFSINMAAQTLFWLNARFSQIHILEKKIMYEPLYNLRLAKQITLLLKD